MAARLSSLRLICIQRSLSERRQIQPWRPVPLLAEEDLYVGA